MKEISKIAKSFTCECGTVNKFEFETDFDVHDIRMAVKCQACGRERTIELMNFFRKHPTFIQPIIRSEYSNQNVDFIGLTNQNQFLANISQNQQDLQVQSQISNDEFSEAMPLNILQENQSNNQFSPMNMFNSDSAADIVGNKPSDPSIKQVDAQEKPTQSIYAGLLDLNLIQEEDGIYEPFRKEQSDYGNEITSNDIIIDNQENAFEKYREKSKEKEDEETFSALFGNL
ncbi:MAG: hypothetical protein QXO35_03380 [Candidatus Micrarchaeia archaeon]